MHPNARTRMLKNVTAVSLSFSYIFSTISVVATHTQTLADCTNADDARNIFALHNHVWSRYVRLLCRRVRAPSTSDRWRCTRRLSVEDKKLNCPEKQKRERKRRGEKKNVVSKTQFNICISFSHCRAAARCVKKRRRHSDARANISEKLIGRQRQLMLHMINDYTSYYCFLRAREN